MKLIILYVISCLTLGTLNVLALAQSGDTYRSWSLRYVEASEVQRMLADLTDDAANVRIVINDETNEFLLLAPPKIQKLAARLINSVDIPDSSRARKKDEPTELHAYSVEKAELNNRVELLRKSLGTGARISVLRRNSQILVMASPQIHRLTEKLLSTGSVLKTDSSDSVQDRMFQNETDLVRVSAPSALFPNGTNHSDSRPSVTKVYQIQHYSAEQCQTALNRLLKDQLQVRQNGTVRYKSANNDQVILRFDTKTQTCELNGDQELIAQFVTLFELFERLKDRSVGQSIRLVPLRKVRPEVLERALRLWRESSHTRNLMKGSRSSPNTSGTIQQAMFSPQEVQPAEETEKPDDEKKPGEQDLRPPLLGVSVQPFPGLDVLAIQGKDADVQELIRIIREIERLSEQTVPEIEIFFLQHVHSGGLNRFIEQVLNALTEPLQGRVAVTPISKPNALLIIGWGESVAAAKKLISQLDQPISPDRDMRIFSLKNAGVGEVVTALQQALDRTGGLTPGVAVTPNLRTNSLIVYAPSRDMQEVERLIKHLDSNSSASVSKGRIIRLKNSLATDVATTITTAITAAAAGTTGRQASELEMLLVQPDGQEIVASGILNDVKLTPDARTNTIFVTGPEESLPLVERLIEHLDESPAASAVIKVFEIANGNAADLVTVLRTLFPATSTGSGVPALATAEGETSLVPVRFSVDIRTNTIIATGTSSDLQIMEALLIRLDEVASQERVNEVYRLRNTPATAVAQAVNEFLQSERIVSQAAPGRQNPFEQIQQEVVVVPEEVRNQLIISATPRFFDQIMELVEGLDSKPPQVMIQVILAEVDLSNFHEVGMELGLQDSLLFDRSLLGDLVQTAISTTSSTPAGVVTTTQENIVAASNTPGFDFNNNPLGNSGSNRSQATSGQVAGQGLSHFSVGRTNAKLGFGGLVLSASSENVSVLLRALDQSGSVEILSRPQIMTLDNQEAFIQVGQSVPRIASSSVTQFGQVNTVENTDVGLLLGVIPRINPDGTVVMQVDATKSEVGSEAQGIPIFVSTEGTVVRSPRVNITSAQTTVSAATGQTIVIGGLITTNNTVEHRKIPWLGDLPALGKLFRYDSFANRRTELLIILTPHVVLGRGDAEYLKQVEMSRMSWVSSDVFEFIGSGPTGYSPSDDSDVEVIYPDAVPDVPDLNRSGTSPPVEPTQIPVTDPVPTTSLNDVSNNNVVNDFDGDFDQVDFDQVDFRRHFDESDSDQEIPDFRDQPPPELPNENKQRRFFGIGPGEQS
ncbi:MAG: hypothetical protein MK110_09645 [Fuerstiella sp.]|nr:hypothetical protein [Fuerstiella sp.]